MHPLKTIMILFLFFSFLTSFQSKAEKVKVVNLKTEYTVTPLGIDIEKPRFSWQMQSEGNSNYQKAYRITVTDEIGSIVWKSGKITSGISLNIRYEGTPLKPRRRYVWQIQVWNQFGKTYTAKSWFETGLMNTTVNNAEWNGSSWIGGSDNNMLLYSDYLPVFKIDLSFQLNKVTGSKKAGFIYGANDSRLMDKNKNLYRLQNEKDSSYIMLELDISPLYKKDAAQLHIYRVGYSPEDEKNIPLKSFSISPTLINFENRYEKHSLHIASVLGDTHVYMDGNGHQNLIAKINLNPLGNGGDFIAFPVVGDVGFHVPLGSVTFSDLHIRNYRGPSNVIFNEDLSDTKNYNGIFSGLDLELTIENSAYKVFGKSKDRLIIANPSRRSMPMMRTAFSTSNTNVAKARLYITSRGIYDAYLNGKRIGNDYFNPGLTQYNKTHLYQTYDVTEDIQKGENALGVILGEGWWSGAATYMGEFWNFFGDRQSVLAQLIITYIDGKEDIITTNPNTWKYYNNGPVIYSSFFQGEVYDAIRESSIEGWTSASFDDSRWEKAEEISLENHISKDERNNSFNMPMVDDYSEMKLQGQYGQTVREIAELSAISVEEIRPGVFVYDMGQNIAGIPNIELTGMRTGQKITLRFAEVKYPDLADYKDNKGMLMMENIRTAMAQDIYIAKGGTETISPRFTYHGYRYIEISGIDHELPLKAVKSKVLSSIHELTSSYETSSVAVNKLWQNITWSTFANFMSIPTDCPQRNERLGWSGDISVFSRTATYLAHIPQFLRRHMQAMRDVQRQDGRFPDIAPLGGGFGGVLWGSAGISVAWESYLQYGDVDLLHEHYEAMKDYIDFLVKEIDPHTGVLNEKDRLQWGSLGDWLSPEYDRTEKTLIWEAYFIYNLEQMTKIANLIGKNNDAEMYAKLYAERKIFFNKTYVDEKTGKTSFRGKTVDTQCSYVLPLQFRIFNEENKTTAKENLVFAITRENKTDDGKITPSYSLMTGFIGTAWVNSALSDNGYPEIAYKLLQNRSYPSWLYPVTQGATTIWERLNSYTHTDGFGGNNRMNSFNHYSFGAIGAWMYTNSLGIQREENNPGFKHFILNPEPDPTKEMTYAKGHYDSPYGRIESAWEIDGSDYVYTFKVPANTTATLYLSASSVNNIYGSNREVKKSRHINYHGLKNSKHIFELQSGDYKFRVKSEFN